MQKLRDVVGLPVLETTSGEQIGEVHEVVLNLNKAMICGLEISGPTWFSQERGILFGDLCGIGRDAVTVVTGSVVQDLSALVTTSEALRLSDVCGKQLYTETGIYLGTLVDVLFESGTGEVRFYEVSDGLVTDFLHGRLVMPLPQAQVIQGDRLIVPEVMAELLHAANQEPGGVS